MMTQDIDKQIATVTKLASVIAISLMAVVFVYPIIVEAHLSQSPITPNSLHLSFWVVRLVMFAGILSLIAAPVFAKIPLERGKALYLKTKKPNQLIATWLASFIVGFVFREFAATLGLMLSLITGNRNWCFGLGLAAFITMIRAWPRRHELENLFRSFE